MSKFQWNANSVMILELTRAYMNIMYKSARESKVGKHGGRQRENSKQKGGKYILHVKKKKP